MKRVTYHLTEKQIARLDALSDATGLPVAEHVRRALDEYLSKELGRTASLPSEVDASKDKDVDST